MLLWWRTESAPTLQPVVARLPVIRWPALRGAALFQKSEKGPMAAISKANEVVTLINVFIVEPGNQRA
jgi:hypothetical protein